jgi:hypothetical protein
LGDLVKTLGPTVLDVLVAPAGLDLAVRGTAIYDSVDPVPDGPGSVLILVGTRADSTEALAVVGEAAERGFVALAVKLRGSDGRVIADEAERHGLAVLTAADDVPWRHLDGLVVSVLGASRLQPDGVSGAGGTLFALANALGTIIGGSVAIEDLEQHVLAYSSVEGQQIDALRERGILDRRVPDYPQHRRQYLQVLRSPGVTRFPPVDDELPRAAVAIRAGDLPLGTIWAIEGDGGLRADGERALLDGARVAALQMLRGKDIGERERHVRGEVLRAMLAGTRTTPDAGERLGIVPGAEVSLCAFALQRSDPDGTSIARVGNALSQYTTAHRPEAVTTTTTHAVYALVPGTAAGVRRYAERALPGLVKAAGASVHASLSAPTRDLAAISALRGEVDAVMRAASTIDPVPPIATVSDVHTRLLLDHVARELVRDPRLRHPGVYQVTEHDRIRGTEYGATLLAWLEAQSDAGVAAEKLQVHPNTLRYRLRRVEEKFDLDLSDADSRLSAWLQLRLPGDHVSPP